MALILASSSAARRDMLRAAGLALRCEASGVDEAVLKARFSGSPPELALALAAAKAQSVAARHPGALVIGADQLLVCGSRIFDKPASLDEAAAHLRALSGQRHALVTAVCVVQDSARLWSHTARAELTVRPLSEHFIASYLTAEGPKILACVGAYQLEGRGAQLFDAIDGDYFTILGLPLLPLLAFLRGRGVLAG